LTRHTILPGLDRVTLPMRGAPPTVNVYLLRGRRGWILIDTGMPYVRFAPADLELILVTHLHPDHSGLAAPLREATGAPVALHPADAALLADIHRPGAYARALETQLAFAGTPPDTARAVLDAGTRLMQLFPALTPDIALHHGQTFDTELGPAAILHTPGHSPGHCCVWLEQPRLLLSGDHVLEASTPHIGYLPNADPLADFAATLPALEALPAAQVLPGHGEPFTGLVPAIERIRHRQRARAERLRHLLTENGRSPHELLTRLFARVQRPGDYHFALSSLLALLHHLGEDVSGSGQTPSSSP
jgi:glyoxylase-like metal-dependent hydrolase (beta-lactamase superfamily II)